MKRWILLLLILSNTVIAGTHELVNHEPVTINGRTFELDGRGENQVYVKIDGKTTKVTELYEYRNGVFLQLIDYNDPYDDVPLTATVTIAMDYTCGNSECEIGEKDYCCTDCNCTEGFSCTENQCIDITLHQCLIDDDCDDNNPCTTDICAGVPLECNNSFFSECVSGDDCCPVDCNKTLDYINNDHDCLPEPECWTDFDCNDSDETTIDLCDKKEKFCKFEVLVVGGEAVRSEEVEESEDSVVESEESEKIEVLDFKSITIIGLILVIAFISIKIFKKYKNTKLGSGKKEYKAGSKKHSQRKKRNKDRFSTR